VGRRIYFGLGWSLGGWFIMCFIFLWLLNSICWFPIFSVFILVEAMYIFCGIFTSSCSICNHPFSLQIDCDKTIMVTLKHDDKLQDGTECAFQVPWFFLSCATALSTCWFYLLSYHLGWIMLWSLKVRAIIWFYNSSN
jgi:hypothetical protein